MDSAELLVCQALQAATNPNHEIVKTAEAQLEEWEQQPGFFPTLARLCTKSGVGEHVNNISVRWMAAVYLKNGIERHWRRNTRVELPAEHKSQIRSHLLEHYDTEDVPQVILQVAVLMSRIARFDCPREWPELMPKLLENLQGSDDSAQRQRTILVVFHHVVKALASRRMMAEKRQFEELSGNIFGYMVDLWNGLTTQFFELVKTQPEEVALNCLERAHLATRTLRKLVIYGFGKPYKFPQCMNCIPQIFQRLRQCLELRFELLQMLTNSNSSESTSTPLIDRLERYTLKLMKILNQFLETHPVSFARFVSVALEFSFHYIFHEGTALIFSPNQVINFPNFAIHAINLIKGIMQCGAYAIRAGSPSRDLEDELSSVGSSAQADFFTDERLSYICEKILTHYLLLTQQELEEWHQDPETFGQEERAGDAWRFGLRPCVETFYCTCYTQHGKLMTAEVCKYIRNAQQTELTAESDLKTILQKDAIYNAAGIASFQFFNEIDFGAWFSNHLLTELRIDAPNFRILRRRIIWLLGEWVSVLLSRDLRPLAYEACLHLLRSEEDMSIRLAASRTLNALIDDFDFSPEPFRPYFAALFNALFMLLREATECDTKIAVLTTMSLIVDKMSDCIEPQAEQLISYLPLLWTESEEHNMLRCSIIGTLEQLVKTVKDIPEPMKPFLYSVVDHSTDLEQASHVYLMEDGIMLWTAVVENSTSLTPELFGLCTHLLPIVEASSENLRAVLQLIHAYIILDAQTYLLRYGNQFVDFCTRSFADIRVEGIMTMLRIFETCFKSDPAFGLSLVRPALPYIFMQVYLDKEYPMTMGYYLMIVARTLLIDQSVFMNVIQELQQPNALEKILDVWIERTALVTEVEKRKLFCLAFASIFSNNELLLQRFPVIMQNISETLVEVMEEETDDVPSDQEQPQDESSAGSTDRRRKTSVRYHDQLVIQDENDLDASKYVMDDFYYKTYHYDRCRSLALKDPIHKISITEYLDWQLKSLGQQMGDESFQQLLKLVYPEVLEKIQVYIKHSVHKTNAGDATGVTSGRAFVI